MTHPQLEERTWAQLLPKLSAPASRTRSPSPQVPSHVMQAKTWDTASVAAHHVSQTIARVPVTSRGTSGLCTCRQEQASRGHAGGRPRLWEHPVGSHGLKFKSRPGSAKSWRLGRLTGVSK